MRAAWAGLIGVRQMPCRPQNQDILTSVLNGLAVMVSALATACASGNSPSTLLWKIRVGTASWLSRLVEPLLPSNACGLSPISPNSSPVSPAT